MTRMDTYRALTPGEIAALEASGSTADDWSSIEVAEDFHPSQLRGARLGGRVRLASGVRIRNSGVRNYDIGARTLVEEVVRLECRGESAFGNGTEVAVMNENGGRTVRIYSGLTAQIAYMAAVYRHRPALVAALDRILGSIISRLVTSHTVCHHKEVLKNSERSVSHINIILIYLSYHSYICYRKCSHMLLLNSHSLSLPRSAV